MNAWMARVNELVTGLPVETHAARYLVTKALPGLTVTMRKINLQVERINNANEQYRSPKQDADDTRLLNLHNSLLQFINLCDGFKDQEVRRTSRALGELAAESPGASALGTAKNSIDGLGEYVKQMREFADDALLLLAALLDPRQASVQPVDSSQLEVARQQVDYVLLHETVFRDVAAQTVISVGDLDQLLDAETGIPSAVGRVVYQLNATVQGHNAADTIAQCLRRGTMRPWCNFHICWPVRLRAQFTMNLTPL